MSRKLMLICALASVAMIPAAASAHPGGGAGGPPAGAGGMGNAGGFGTGGPGGLGNSGMSDGGRDFGIGTRDSARANNQAASNAADTAAQHANWNSVFGGTTATKSVKSGALAGVTTGMTLFSNGVPVGTVQQIRTTANGSVAVVIVKGTNGGFYAVPATKLSFAGGTLSTSARLNGINGSNASTSQARLNSQGPVHASATGIAHANQHSVLSGTSGTSLTGVTVGMPLFSNNTQVGTVQRVITANGVLTRVLVKGTNGRTYSLAPAALSTANGMLVTSTPLRGM